MADLLNVHPEVRRRFDLLAQSLRRSGFKVQVTSGYRSIAEQRRLFERRQRGEHPLPVATPGCSQHNYGRAIDAVVTPDASSFLDGLARAFGLEWAGPADPVHFGAESFAVWNSILQRAGLRCQ